MISDKVAAIVTGRDALDVPSAYDAMCRAARNLGRLGIAACAISAVDVALWDLHARLAGLPLAVAVGQVHDRVPVYGSGGFTSYDDRQLTDQLRGWVDAGASALLLQPLDDETDLPAFLARCAEVAGILRA